MVAKKLGWTVKQKERKVIQRLSIEMARKFPSHPGARVLNAVNYREEGTRFLSEEPRAWSRRSGRAAVCLTGGVWTVGECLSCHVLSWLLSRIREREALKRFDRLCTEYSTVVQERREERMMVSKTWKATVVPAVLEALWCAAENYQHDMTHHTAKQYLWTATFWSNFLLSRADVRVTSVLLLLNGRRMLQVRDRDGFWPVGSRVINQYWFSWASRAPMHTMVCTRGNIVFDVDADRCNFSCD